MHQSDEGVLLILSVDRKASLGCIVFHAIGDVKMMKPEDEWTLVLDYDGKRIPIPSKSWISIAGDMSLFVNRFVASRKSEAARSATRVTWSMLKRYDYSFKDVFRVMLADMASDYGMKIFGNPNISFAKNFVFHDTIVLKANEADGAVYSLALKSVSDMPGLKEDHPLVYSTFTNLEDQKKLPGLDLLEIIARLRPCDTHRSCDITAWEGLLFIDSRGNIRPFIS